MCQSHSITCSHWIGFQITERVKITDSEHFASSERFAKGNKIDFCVNH
jgi:hypothetical protein